MPTLVRLRYAVFDADDDFVESEVLTYRHGEGMLLPAVEAAVDDLPIGGTTEVRLTPDCPHPLAGVPLRVVVRVLDVLPAPGARRHRRPKGAARRWH